MKNRRFICDAGLVIKQVVSASPKVFVLMQLLAIGHGLSWGFNTLFTQNLFDECLYYLEGTATLNKVFVALAILGVSYTFCQVINGVHSFTYGMFFEKVSGRLQARINKKVENLSPEEFENTEALDCINKANEGKNNAVSFVMSGANIIFSYVPNYTFMTWYLFYLKPVLAFAILLVFVPTILSQFVRIKAYVSCEDKVAPIRREYEHYEKCMTDREFLKETRHLGAYSYFINKYKRSIKQINTLTWKANLKNKGIEFLLRVLTLICYIGILLVIFYYLCQGEISVGSFAAVIVPIGGLFDFFDGVVCREVKGMVHNVGSIKNYIKFLKLDERLGEDMELSKDSIVLENVYFRYPNSNRCALKDINLIIRKGEKIAVVGENGSGKTTLIRIITGLYLPYSGRVLYDDKDISRLSMKVLFKNTTGIFQRFQKYQMSLKDNIVISDMEYAPSDEYVDRVAEIAGVNVGNTHSFPAGYDTILSREFGGKDISGGQWQRVAIARGLYRTSKLIVLDEPTSAIDPIEENSIFQKFQSAAENKIAILVTHRLGCVKFADRIIVMDKGRIIGEGTHEELMGSCKKYTAIYNSQLSNFREEVIV